MKHFIYTICVLNVSITLFIWRLWNFHDYSISKQTHRNKNIPELVTHTSYYHHGTGKLWRLIIPSVLVDQVKYFTNNNTVTKIKQLYYVWFKFEFVQMIAIMQVSIIILESEQHKW